MDNSSILNRIDHTLLRPTCTWEEIKSLCTEAITNKMASVCVPPSYVARIRDEFGSVITICTVIGFPLGYNTTATKVEETRQAILDGADEIDMVVNLGDVKNGDFPKVTKEIASVKEVTGSLTLKVIVECCYLDEAEKIALCRCVTQGGADYIKTSTGFGTGGATLEDVELFKKHIGENVKIKAAGGVRTLADFESFIAAGCDRIGASSGNILF